MQDDRARLERTAVVLAAGFGSRLAQGFQRASLKPLTPVAGVPLVERTVRSLKLGGCTRVVIVLGYEAAAIRASIERQLTLPLPVEFVDNPHYELKNGVSVLAARDHVGQQFVVTMADHVFGPEVMARAAAHRAPPDTASLLVDHKLAQIFDMDDATKVLEQDGKIAQIGKHLEQFNCVDTGLFVCTRALFGALDSVYRRQGDVSLSEGVGVLCESGRMQAVDIGEGFWQDIDTPEMLAHAERCLHEREA
jgi:1L-myo-inositol 1-phosphate cytidylyltransferase